MYTLIMTTDHEKKQHNGLANVPDWQKRISALPSNQVRHLQCFVTDEVTHFF